MTDEERTMLEEEFEKDLEKELKKIRFEVAFERFNQGLMYVLNDLPKVGEQGAEANLERIIPFQKRRFTRN